MFHRLGSATRLGFMGEKKPLKHVTEGAKL